MNTKNFKEITNESLIELKKNCNISSKTRLLILNTPYLLETKQALAAEMCISTLFIQMMNNKNPKYLIDFYTNYVFDCFETHEEKNEILYNFVTAMSYLRENELMEFLSDKINFNSYNTIYKLIFNKGNELLGKITVDF